MFNWKRLWISELCPIGSGRGQFVCGHDEPKIVNLGRTLHFLGHPFRFAHPNASPLYRHCRFLETFSTLCIPIN